MLNDTINSDISNNSYHYLSASGSIAYNMTNDYMFRITFQQNTVALKGLICSLLKLDPDTVDTVTVLNPVVLGESIADKEYRMDVRVKFNDDTKTDLEMQLRNYEDWPERSLLYLCREFSDIKHGEDYKDVNACYQISFIDFTLFRDHPEFVGHYRMKNVKDGYQYTDKFNIIVVELRNTKLAVKEDIDNGIDKWVNLFKATTWEEMQMIAGTDKVLSSAAESVYLSNEDYNVRKIAREREDFLIEQECREKKTQKLTEDNDRLTKDIEKLTENNEKLNVDIKKLSREKEETIIRMLQDNISPEQAAFYAGISIDEVNEIARKNTQA